jgi:hypothetical protein
MSYGQSMEPAIGFSLQLGGMSSQLGDFTSVADVGGGGTTISSIVVDKGGCNDVSIVVMRTSIIYIT